MATGLEGAAELDRKLAALADPKDTGKVLRSGVGSALRTVAKKKAEANAPQGDEAHRTHKGRLVAPGFASRSLTVKTFLSRDKQKAIGLLGVRSEAFYALQFIELGTKHIAAQPWLEPAFQSSKTAMLKRLIYAMQRRYRKIAALR